MEGTKSLKSNKKRKEARGKKSFLLGTKVFAGKGRTKKHHLHVAIVLPGRKIDLYLAGTGICVRKVVRRVNPGKRGREPP